MGPWNPPHVDMGFWNVCIPHNMLPGSPDTTMELGSGVKVATGTSGGVSVGWWPQFVADGFSRTPWGFVVTNP